MLEEIIALARAMSGSAEDALLETFCQVAQEELERRLRQGVTPEACGSAFACAGACLACAALYETDAAGGGGVAEEPHRDQKPEAQVQQGPHQGKTQAPPQDAEDIIDQAQTPSEGCRPQKGPDLLG